VELESRVAAATVRNPAVSNPYPTPSAVFPAPAPLSRRT
jgi:hypothetical protein